MANFELNRAIMDDGMCEYIQRRKNKKGCGPSLSDVVVCRKGTWDRKDDPCRPFFLEGVRRTACCGRDTAKYLGTPVPTQWKRPEFSEASGLSL